jgi:hypothetical protein
LAAAGAEVRLAHPLGINAFSYRRVKNDEVTQPDLAGLLRMGRLPEVWIFRHYACELRELNRWRIKLMRPWTSCAACLREAANHSAPSQGRQQGISASSPGAAASPSDWPRLTTPLPRTRPSLRAWPGHARNQ